MESSQPQHHQQLSPAALQLTTNANFEAPQPCSQTIQSDKITTPVGRATDNLMGKNMQVPTLNDWLGRNDCEFQYHHTHTFRVR